MMRYLSYLIIESIFDGLELSFVVLVRKRVVSSFYYINNYIDKLSSLNIEKRNTSVGSYLIIFP